MWRFDVENIPKGRMVDKPGPKGRMIQVHVPDVLVVARTRKRLRALTDASQAYAGCADKAPVVNSIVLAFDRTH